MPSLQPEPWPSGGSTIGFWFAIKRNGLLIRAVTWMNLKGTLLGSTQTQKVTIYMIPFT